MEKYLAAAGGIEGAQKMHERRFARTARPHDGHKLARVNLEAHTIEGLYDPAALRVVLGGVA